MFSLDVSLVFIIIKLFIYNYSSNLKIGILYGLQTLYAYNMNTKFINLKYSNFQVVVDSILVKRMIEWEEEWFYTYIIDTVSLLAT